MREDQQTQLDNGERGTYQSVPFSHYLAIPDISHSTASVANEQSPEHAEWGRENPKAATPAMSMGSALHCLALTPELYSEEVTVLDMASRNNNAYWSLREDEPDTIVLLAKEEEIVYGMRDSIMGRPHIAALFSQPPEDRELTILWELEIPGDDPLKCKSRLDLPLFSTSCICDLKTCEDASPNGFDRKVRYGSYGTQAAFYNQAAWAAGHTPQSFVFLAIERKPPYGCMLHEVSQAMLAKRWGEMETTLRLLAANRTHVSWPGYPAEPNLIDVKPWELRDADQADANLPGPVGEGEDL